MPPAGRPYVSRNRQQPCDRCRQQKLRCQLDGPPPCQRCVRSNISCTFSRKRGQLNSVMTPTSGRADRSSEAVSSPQSSRGGRSTSQPGPVQSNVSMLSEGLPVSTQTANRSLPGEHQWVPTPSQIGPLLPEQGLPTQVSQSLDNMKGHSYQLFGVSSEADPWLLRHCKYDELGFRGLFKVHIRNPGGVPTRDKIPTHFMVSDEALSEAAIIETRVSTESDMRAELFRYIPANYGVRLLRL